MLNRSLVALFLSFVSALPAFAQNPPPAPPPSPWAVTASGGLSFTGGNSDTSTVNLAYGVVRDPKARNVLKSSGLFLRGSSAGVTTTNRVNLDARDEYRFAERAFVFGQGQFLRDEFKGISSLVATTVGVGYALVRTPLTSLSIDTSAGGVWERHPSNGLRASGALTAEQKFSRKFGVATLTQSVAVLSKTQRLSDSLATFTVGLSSAMSKHTQLKIEALDTFKNEPPAIGLQKNDVALLIAIVYKS